MPIQMCTFAVSGVRNMARLLVLAVSCTVAGPALAQASAPTKTAPSGQPAPSASAPRNLNDALSQGIGLGADQIKAVKRLPVQGMSIIETTDGKTFVASDNGRIAIIGGRIIDLYESRQINGVADADSLDKINLRRMGIKPSDIASFSVGTGPVQVTVFVDPLCEPCRRLLADMANYSRSHTFDVVIYPVQGSMSGRAAKRVTCAPNKEMALQALISGNYTSLPEPPRDCDVSVVQKGMVTAAVLGIRTVPFMVFGDGKTAYGSSLRLASAIAR